MISRSKCRVAGSLWRFGFGKVRGESIPDVETRRKRATGHGLFFSVGCILCCSGFFLIKEKNSCTIADDAKGQKSFYSTAKPLALPRRLNERVTER